MKYPFVSQSGNKDCGVASLLMIMRYYGGGASIEHLRDITHTTKDGVDAYSLLEAAKTFDFSTRGVRGKIENFDPIDLPCIAHVVIDKSYQHFIVIYQIDFKKRKLLIADPASSIKKLTFDQFNKISTDTYLLLYPNKKLIPFPDKSNILELLINMLSKQKRNIIILILISIFFTFLGIITSFQFQILLDYVINYSSIYNLFIFTFIFTIIILFKEWLGLYRNLLLHYFNHIVSNQLIKKVYHHLLSLPYLYYKNRSTGEIVARVQDLENIKNFLGKIFVTCCIDLLLLIFSYLILWKLNYKLTIILSIISIILIFITLLFSKIISKPISKMKENSSLTNSYLVETISGIETVRGFGIEDYVEYNFSNKLNNFEKVSYKVHKTFTVIQTYKNLIEEIGVFLLLAIGGYMVMMNNFSLGVLITYYSLLSYFLEPIRNLFNICLEWKDATLSIKRVDELLQVPKDKIIDSKLKGNKLKGNLIVSNLEYYYNPKRKILNKLSFKINSCDRVLIYGKSGSGKSTLAKILSGILPSDSGKIILDNYPLTEYNTTYLKNKVCYLSQNEMIFYDSVYNNIYLNSDRNYQDFLDICNLCLVDEIVFNHPLKYDMLLEENGFNISGGERQRILLARAILKGADIYIYLTKV